MSRVITPLTFDGLLGGRVGAWLLQQFLTPPDRPPAGETRESEADESFSGLEFYFGDQFASHVKGRTVLDYGCGHGRAVVSLAHMGADLAVGMDIRDSVLNSGRTRAAEEHVADRCMFLNAHDHRAVAGLYGRIDDVVSIDAFEHYADPQRELAEMWKLVRPGGSVFIYFGPPWWHPHGCHMKLMGAPPWSHILFKEETIMSLRARYRSDGARRYEEVEGGLNRMTIHRFEALVRQSGFEIKHLNPVPIRGTAPLCRTGLLRELFTSVVRAHLCKP